MIPSGVEIFVALTPIDLRWGFDRLAGLTSEYTGRAARSGALVVFFGKRKSAMKILFFDGSGLVQFYKRLDSGTFRVPLGHGPNATSVSLNERKLDDLLDAINLEPDKPPQGPRRSRIH